MGKSVLEQGRPRHVLWIELLAVAEVGLSIALPIFDPIEDDYVWPDILAAAVILALTLWFTRGGTSIARWVLIGLNGLTILAAALAIFAYSQQQAEEIKWALCFLALSLASLWLLFSKPTRKWVQGLDKANVEAAGDVD